MAIHPNVSILNGIKTIHLTHFCLMNLIYSRNTISLSAQTYGPGRKMTSKSS